MAREIRNSAKAIVIKDGKLLAIKISDGREEWYILPGGGQESEELLPQAVEREVAEEIYPSKLRRVIMNYCEDKPYIKYLGNEEIGDPECLE